MAEGRPDDREAVDRSPDPDGGGDGSSEPGGDGFEFDESRSGRAAFLDALRVKRNAKWGLAVGITFTVLVMHVFDVIARSGQSSLWYVGLGFVFAMSVAGLVAVALTLGRAVRLSREL